MGHKVHPTIHRTPFVYTWDSKWFAGKRDLPLFMQQEVAIRAYLGKKLKEAGWKGEQVRYVLKKMLGSSDDKLKELEKEKIIGYWANRVGERPPSYYDMENDPVFNYTEGAVND